jgi:hypothetical protein
MPFASEGINGAYKPAVIFAGIATYNCGGGIASGPVAAQNLAGQGIFQVNYLSLIKFNVSHIFRSSVLLLNKSRIINSINLITNSFRCKEKQKNQINYVPGGAVTIPEGTEK